MFQTYPLKLASMLSKFLKIQEQMILNIGKKLKTASLNARFTGSKKEECTSTCSLLNPKVTVNIIITYKFTHQQPQGRFTSLKKCSMEKVTLISH